MADMHDDAPSASLYGLGLDESPDITAQALDRYRDVAREILETALAHCAQCNVWLSPRESCPHMPRGSE